MTREEKQKAIDALKISAPLIAVTQEEFKDYIQTLNKIMDWLDQEPILDKIKGEIENHCGLVKENHCKYCSYCNSVMGVREILEIIDKYKAESEPQESEKV